MSKKTNFQFLKAWLCVQRIPISFIHSIVCSSDFKNYNFRKINNLSEFVKNVQLANFD